MYWIVFHSYLDVSPVFLLSCFIFTLSECHSVSQSTIPYFCENHARTLNNRVNKLHEKCLHVSYIGKKNQHFKTCLTWINLFQYAINICKSSQQKCINWQTGYPRQFLQILSRAETSLITICGVLLALKFLYLTLYLLELKVSFS